MPDHHGGCDRMHTHSVPMMSIVGPMHVHCVRTYGMPCVRQYMHKLRPGITLMSAAFTQGIS